MTENKIKIAQQRLGEKNTANNGMNMVIVAYRKASDIDILFEDGSKVCNKNYKDFKKGSIAHPSKKNRIGETNISKKGVKMTIVGYRGSEDVDIQYEDGTTVYHKTYKFFKQGKTEKQILTSIIGETIRANNGMNMTIIECRNRTDIDIQFEDGTIAKNKQYSNFKKGYIAHPSKYEKHPDTLANTNRIGEKNIASNGMCMEIIAYRNCHDVDIKFEDGKIVYNKSYFCFKDGCIAHPSKRDRLGEVNYSTDGKKMTIVSYCGSHDIDVLFEDGTILVHQNYTSFKEGFLGCKHRKTKLIGTTNCANNGMKMTIIAFRNLSDIDIQFEDGFCVYNKTYSSFKSGSIRHPFALIQQRIGEKNTNKQGLKMEIINYQKYDNIDVLFEDGTVLYHKNYYQFKQGAIRKPNNTTQKGNTNGN